MIEDSDTPKGQSIDQSIVVDFVELYYKAMYKNTEAQFEEVQSTFVFYESSFVLNKSLLLYK